MRRHERVNGRKHSLTQLKWTRGGEGGDSKEHSSVCCVSQSE
jgi:hypothetical protein